MYVKIIHNFGKCEHKKSFEIKIKKYLSSMCSAFNPSSLEKQVILKGNHKKALVYCSKW
jgi:hypothetical protein